MPLRKGGFRERDKDTDKYGLLPTFVPSPKMLIMGIGNYTFLQYQCCTMPALFIILFCSADLSARDLNTATIYQHRTIKLLKPFILTQFTPSIYFHFTTFIAHSYKL